MFSKRDQIILLFLIAAVVTGVAIMLIRDYRRGISYDGSSRIEVLFTGRIARPGLYTVQVEDTFGELLRSAGAAKGLRGEIKVDVVEPGDQAYATININKATRQELESLPGIGPKFAQDIISYRGKNGFFTDREQLMKIKGIGPAKFSRMEKFITLSDETEGPVPAVLRLRVGDSGSALSVSPDSGMLVLFGSGDLFSGEDMASRTQKQEGVPLRLRMDVR